MATPYQAINPVVSRPRWAKQFAIVLSLLVLAGAIAIVFAGQSAQASLAARYAAPGRLVPVDGAALHLNCQGEGSPTVILESGLGAYSIYWEEVQPNIAGFTRVCSYDRAGYGWSSAGLQPRTADRLVAELHSLLGSGGIGAPYVLVGHSYGGLLAQLYTRNYPDEVTGVVLVDSVHAEQEARLPAYAGARQQMTRRFEGLALLRRIGILALFSDSIPNPGLPARTYREWQALTATTGYFETSNAESASMAASLADFRAGGAPDLGDVPLVVLTRGRAVPVPGMTTDEVNAAEHVWQELQSELVGLSTHAEQVVAQDSGHDIAVEQPDLVVAAVEQLVAAAQQPTTPAEPSTEAPPPPAPHAEHSVAAAPTPEPAPTATTLPSPTESPVPSPAAPLHEAEFTLRTEFRGGRMLYVGVGGAIEGVVNPDLLVEPDTRVRVVLVNGDGINHDVYFPDFDAHTPVIGRRDQTAEIEFTVRAGQSGAFVYYCTLPGHREAGQEGQMLVSE